jgi:hypothetical protein
MPLQITTLWALHSVYNDKVCETSEVPKLLDRSLDCQYTPLGRTDLPRRFKQDKLCRAELLDNFLDNSLFVDIGLVHHSTYMSLTLARLCGEWQLVSGNYKTRGASGGKYEAQIVIFCILAAVNRFSWISWKAESL